MDVIFVISKNSKPSDRHRPILNLTDKINLKRSERYVPLSNLSSICYTCRNAKSYTKTKFKINSKYQRQHGIINLNYLMDYVPHQIFKIILSILSKNMKH